MPDPILAYEFSPANVSVSLVGDNAIDSLIDLHVKINSRGTAAMVGGITITIPVGANDGSRLSIGDLSAPVYDHAAMQGWTIEIDEVNKSIVHISPVPKTSPKALDSTIEFTLQDILVNKTVGIVPITVDEFAPSHVKATFQIDKEDADRPVKKFYVTDENGQELNPPVLYDLDQKVKLKWDCTDEGKSNYSFGVRTSAGQTWQPKDCLSRRQCYSCQDGTDGVLTEGLSQTTTFALDVVKTDGARRRLHSILYTTVDLEMPVIRSKSVKAKHFKGRSVRLHWLAESAKRCELRLDEQMIDAEAPADTYKNGYYVSIGTGPGKYGPSLTAYARMGAATEAEPFLPVTVDPLIEIDTQVPLRLMAITPDGTLAVGTSGGQDANLHLIDTSAKTAKQLFNGRSSVWPDNQSTNILTSLAFAPDGKSLLAHLITTTEINTQEVHGWSARQVWVPRFSTAIVVLEAPEWNARGGPIRLTRMTEDNPFSCNAPGSIAITPRGDRALVTYPPSGVIVVDSGGQTGDYPGCINPSAIAVSPDGRYALVGLAAGQAQLIDLATREVKEVTLSPAVPLAIVFTANSRRAFVLSADTGDGKNVSVLDGFDSTLRVAATITSTGARPNSIALTTPAQGSPELAVIANGDGSLTVVKVDDLSAKPVHIPLDPGVAAAGPIVISKTGGLNNHGVGLVATNKSVIRFDVDELPRGR